MSVNQRGRIVGQVIHPGVAAPERKQKRVLTPRPHPPAPSRDIIEISSDEDEELQPPPKRTFTKRGYPLPTHEADYKARLSQKDREIERLKKREKELERAIAIQKKEIEAKKSQNVPKVDEIEEELTCEICAMRMWLPYRLTECGHVFCLGCVLDWFDNTHVRFLNSHPEYTPLPAYYQGVLRRPFEYPQEFFKVSMHLTHHPSPQYTCPSCRMTVTRRPVEDFKVKTLVSWLGSVQGVAPPESRIPPGTGTTVFDGYSLL